MLYTSYFGQINNFPHSFIPIAICAKSPNWYTGLEYKKLAPSYNCLMEYKNTGNVDDYCKRYTSETLDKLSAQSILNDIWSLLPQSAKDALESDTYHWAKNPLVHVVLLCYEKPDSFCHRDLVADKLKRAGYSCTEWLK